MHIVRTQLIVKSNNMVTAEVMCKRNVKYDCNEYNKVSHVNMIVHTGHVYGTSLRIC